ncbi:MAG: nucleotide exchange factor GrpE [Myxococcales bacterium]|nr:nucleotide exchange factor GrpE [Myxococcales bacterium]
MSEDKAKETQAGSEAPPGDGGGNGKPTAEAAPVAPPPEPTLEERLAEQTALVQKSREQMLRVAADFDNFRKRSQRELEDTRRRAVQGLVKDLLPVFDNLERATAHVGPGTDVGSLAEGLRMVRKQLETTLGRLGIERLGVVGKPFDPAFHESIQYVESADHPAGAIVGEVQCGYVMGTELVRPAMVIVSRGPAAAPAPEAAGDAAPSAPSDGAPAPSGDPGHDP